MKLSGLKVAGLGHRMTRALVAEMDIGSPWGTEYTKWVKPVEFPSTIAPFSCDNDDAAKELMRHTDSPYEWSFWTDGSRLDTGRTEASVAWRQTE